jgi:hypothetical protein
MVKFGGSIKVNTSMPNGKGPGLRPKIGKGNGVTSVLQYTGPGNIVFQPKRSTQRSGYGVTPASTPAPNPAPTPASTPASTLESFDNLDGNGDGSIDITEATTGGKPSNWVEMHDMDNDGSIDRLEHSVQTVAKELESKFHALFRELIGELSLPELLIASLEQKLYLEYLKLLHKHYVLATDNTYTLLVNVNCCTVTLVIESCTSCHNASQIFTNAETNEPEIHPLRKAEHSSIKSNCTTADAYMVFGRPLVLNMVYELASFSSALDLLHCINEADVHCTTNLDLMKLTQNTELNNVLTNLHNYHTIEMTSSAVVSITLPTMSMVSCVEAGSSVYLNAQYMEVESNTLGCLSEHVCLSSQYDLQLDTSVDAVHCMEDVLNNIVLFIPVFIPGVPTLYIFFSTDKGLDDDIDPTPTKGNTP